MRRGAGYAVEFRARTRCEILLPALPVPPTLVFAKLHRRDPRTLIFDEQLGKRGADLLPPRWKACARLSPRWAEVFSSSHCYYCIFINFVVREG